MLVGRSREQHQDKGAASRCGTRQVTHQDSRILPLLPYEWIAFLGRNHIHSHREGLGLSVNEAPFPF